MNTQAPEPQEKFFITGIVKIGGSTYIKIPKEIYNTDKTYNRPIKLYGRWMWTKDNILKILVSDKPFLFENFDSPVSNNDGDVNGN